MFVSRRMPWRSVPETFTESGRINPVYRTGLVEMINFGGGRLITTIKQEASRRSYNNNFNFAGTVPVYTRWGRALPTDPVHAETDDINYRFPRNITTTFPLTWMGVMATFATGSSWSGSMMFYDGAGSGPGQPVMGLDHTGTFWRLSLNFGTLVGVNVLSDSSVELGRLYCFCARTLSETDHRFYRDGVEVATSSSSVGTTVPPTDHGFRFRDNTVLPQHLYWQALWDIDLGLPKIEALGKNHFDIFEPKRTSVYVRMAEPAASTDVTTGIEIPSVAPVVSRHFDGSTGYLTVKGAVFPTQMPLTIAYWLYATSATSLANIGITVDGSTSPHIIMAQNKSGSNLRLSIQYHNGTDQRVMNQSSGNFPIDAWNHVVGVFNMGAHEGWVNNASVVTGADSDTNSFAGLDTVCVGAFVRATVTQYLAGRIAVPCIWQGVLTQVERTRLYNGEHPTKIRPDAILFAPDMRGTTPILSAPARLSSAPRIHGTTHAAPAPPALIKAR